LEARGSCHLEWHGNVESYLVSTRIKTDTNTILTENVCRSERWDIPVVAASVYAVLLVILLRVMKDRCVMLCCFVYLLSFGRFASCDVWVAPRVASVARKQPCWWLLFGGCCVSGLLCWWSTAWSRDWNELAVDIYSHLYCRPPIKKELINPLVAGWNLSLSLFSFVGGYFCIVRPEPPLKSESAVQSLTSWLTHCCRRILSDTCRRREGSGALFAIMLR
jgi:hypothetical protein